MKTRWPYIIAGGVLLLVGVGAAVFWFGYERVEMEVRVGPSGEARRNPYLALERLMGHYANSVETEWSRRRPGSTGTLLFASGTPSIRPDQLSQWSTWVESGGHLIVVAPPKQTTPSDAAPPKARLLDRLGFQPRTSETPVGRPASRWDVYAIGSEEQLETLSSIAWTSPAVDWTAEAATGHNLAISRPRERGRVTLLASSYFFRNEPIGRGEYATLARDLWMLGSERAQHRLRIVRFLRERSWVSYVLGHLWPAALTLLAIIVLALWQGRYRFGPIRHEGRETSYRSRLEHVRASGRFLWQHGGEARLIEATRSALFEHFEREHPGFRDAPRDEQRRRLVESWSLSESEAQQLLRSPETCEIDDFVDWIETLESYRRTM